MMESKTYPLTDDEQPCLACEPVVRVAEVSLRDDRQASVIPDGVPQSVAMAIADIEEGEKEFEQGKTFTHRQVMKMVWDKIGSYAN